MEWIGIGCTVCEIFAFKLYCDLETGVRGHSRSSKAALFDRTHTTLYSFFIVICLYLVPFTRYSRILVENCYPLEYGAPVGVKPSDLRNNLWWRKTRMMGLSDSERISMMRSAVLIQYTRVPDGRTDRQTELAWHIRAIAYMLSRVKITRLFLLFR